MSDVEILRKQWKDDYELRKNLINKGEPIKEQSFDSAAYGQAYYKKNKEKADAYHKEWLKKKKLSRKALEK